MDSLTPSPIINNPRNSKSMTQILGLTKAFFAFLIAAIVNEIVPIGGFLITTLLLVVADTITGIQAARKRGESINSKGLRRTVEKFIMYAIAILCANRVELQYFPDFPLVFGVAAYIGMTELYSNLENIGVVNNIDLIGKAKQILGK